MRVVGTAGHVDHGKSALVRALTGTEPDRWEEERRRGMTLDLGFAHLRFDDGAEAGIVDVPGHERFVHNMLDGITFAVDVSVSRCRGRAGPRTSGRWLPRWHYRVTEIPYAPAHGRLRWKRAKIHRGSRR